MKFSKVLIVAVVLLMYSALSNNKLTGRIAMAKVTPAPPVAVTGAPDEGTCVGCHYTYDLNSGFGTVYITGLPTVYTPGQTYTGTITVADPLQQRWGFELTAIDKSMTSANVGTLDVSNPQVSTRRTGTTDSGYSRIYLSHYWAGGAAIDGSYPGQKSSASWNFTWTAPAATAGDISFFAAGNAAEGGVSPEYDYIRTTSFVSHAPTGITALSSYADLKGTTQITITISGNFGAGAVAQFNSQAVTTSAVAGGLSATIPAGLLNTTGAYPVTVKLQDGTVTAPRYFVVCDRFTTWKSVTTVDAASYQGVVSAGQIAAAFGTEFNTSSTGAPAAAVPLATTLLGSKVFVNGRPAPLFYVRNDQINYQIPYETEIGTQNFVALGNNGIASTSTINVSAFAPAIFTVNQSGTGQAAALNSIDYSANNAGRKVNRGEYISVFATGSGAQLLDDATRAILSGVNGQTPGSVLTSTSTKPVATIGGKPAEIGFSGLAPGYVGLWQLNIKVPADAPVGDAVELAVGFGDRVAQKVAIGVK